MNSCELCGRATEYRICVQCSERYAQTFDESGKHHPDCPKYSVEHPKLPCVCSIVKSHHYA